MECRSQFPGLTGSSGETKTFPNAHTHRRRRLYHHVLIGVIDRPKDTILMAGLLQSAYRANHDALTAIGTGCVANGKPKGRRNHRLETAVFRSQDGGGLNLVADTDAAAAQDTLIGVPGEGFTDINGTQIALPLIGRLLYPQFPAQRLKFTVLVSGTGQALFVVIGEEQLIHGFPGFLYLGVVGLNNHTVPGLHHAGGLQILCRRVDLFHHTDPAGAILVDALQITQFRDMNAVALRRLQDGAAGGCGTFFPVDREFNLCHDSYLLSQRRQRLASARASSSCMPRFRSQKLPTAFSASICLVRKRLWGTISPSM